MYLRLINQYALETCAKVEVQLHAIYTLMDEGEWSASRCGGCLIFCTLGPFQKEQARLKRPCRTDQVTRSASRKTSHNTNRWPVWQLCTTCHWTLTKGGLDFQSTKQCFIFRLYSRVYWPCTKHSLFPSSALGSRRRQNQDTGSHGFESGLKDQLWVSTVPHRKCWSTRSHHFRLIHGC